MSAETRVGRVRFFVEEAAAGYSPRSFAEALLRDARVRGALGPSRWRLLHVRPLERDEKPAEAAAPQECRAVFYSYVRNRAIAVTGPARGGGPLQIEVSRDQPLPSRAEFEAAVAILERSAAWGRLLREGGVAAYEPMPPMAEPEGGEEQERTLFVGLVSKRHRFHRIVAVNMVRETPAEGIALPPRVMATGQAICGEEYVPCSIRPFPGTPGTLVLEWPTPDPVWRMRVIRPSASAGLNGSGIELRGVRYRGKKVLAAASVPILSVDYDQDLCGPFRDWLFNETCFEANGTDVPGTQGFRWCAAPPRTISDGIGDAGNFTGVALWETAEGALSMVTQCYAGWYRYVMEWTFHPDGRIQPRFKFGGVQNSCICHLHYHHALWRLDFDILDHPNSVYEWRKGAWKRWSKERSLPRVPGQEHRWRVESSLRPTGYEIVPGEGDGVGNDFSGHDFYALLFRKNREYDDGQRYINRGFELTRTRLDRFVKDENIKNQDVVVWYAAHFYHDEPDEPGAAHSEHGVAIGPDLVPYNWPGA